MNEHDATEVAYLNGYKQGVVDAVRKMQEAIKERCIKGGIYPVFVESVVDNVARELLGVPTPAKLLSLEDVSQAITDYCKSLIDNGRDTVDVVDLHADLQAILRESWRNSNDE